MIDVVSSAARTLQLVLHDNRRLFAAGSALSSATSKLGTIGPFLLYCLPNHSVGGHSKTPFGNPFLPNCRLYMWTMLRNAASAHWSDNLSISNGVHRFSTIFQPGKHRSNNRRSRNDGNASRGVMLVAASCQTNAT